MKRIERLLREVSLLRVKRAARAQGLCPVEPDYDWIAEAGSVQTLLYQFAEGELPEDADHRRSGPIDVLDVALLDPFIAAMVDAAFAKMAEMGVEAAVFEPAWRAVMAQFAAKPERDLDRIRRGMVQDLAAFAIQMSLFEVARQFALRLDAARRIAPSSDPATIVIEGGRARRLRRPRVIENAGEIAKAALAGLKPPAARLAKSRNADPDIKEAMARVRAERRVAKARKRSGGEKSDGDQGGGERAGGAVPQATS